MSMSREEALARIEKLAEITRAATVEASAKAGWDTEIAEHLFDHAFTLGKLFAQAEAKVKGPK
jgi:hypothetical protein